MLQPGRARLKVLSSSYLQDSLLERKTPKNGRPSTTRPHMDAWSVYPFSVPSRELHLYPGPAARVILLCTAQFERGASVLLVDALLRHYEQYLASSHSPMEIPVKNLARISLTQCKSAECVNYRIPFHVFAKKKRAIDPAGTARVLPCCFRTGGLGWCTK